MQFINSLILIALSIHITDTGSITGVGNPAPVYVKILREGNGNSKILLRFLLLNQTETIGPLTLYSSHRIGGHKCDFYIMKYSSGPITYCRRCIVGSAEEFGGIIPKDWGVLNLLFNRAANKHQVVSLFREKIPDRSVARNGFPTLGTCGLEDRSDISDHHLPSLTESSHRSLVKSKSTKPVIEIAFSVDQLFLEMFANDNVKVEKQVRLMMTGVAAYYQQLEIGIKIVHLEFLGPEKTKLLIGKTQDLNQLAENLSQFHLRNTFGVKSGSIGRDGDVSLNTGKPDIFVTLTGKFYPKLTIGVCRLWTLSGAISTCTFESQIVVAPAFWDSGDLILKPSLQTHDFANYVAHEIAHALGINHQDKCPGCYTTRGACVMQSGAEFALGFWSDCTKSKMKKKMSRPDAYNWSCFYHQNVDPSNKWVKNGPETSGSISRSMAVNGATKLMTTLFHIFLINFVTVF